MSKKKLLITSIVFAGLLLMGGAYATVYQAPPLFDTSLASAISSSATSMTLESGTLRDGTLLNGNYCFTIDSGTTVTEFVCGTASGTSVTNMIRGIGSDGITSTSSLEFAHRYGADVKVTDFPVIQQHANLLSTLGSYAFVSTGLPSIATTSKTIYDNNASSTDDVPFILYMPATTTLLKVSCLNDAVVGNTFTFNVVWGAARASTTQKAFTSGYTCTSTTTPVSVSITGSSTIPAGSVVRLVNSAALTSGETVQIDY